MVDAHLELLNELSIYIHSVQLVMQVSGGSILVGNVAMWAVSDKGRFHACLSSGSAAS
jgi:hypothetical protein